MSDLEVNEYCWLSLKKLRDQDLLNTLSEHDTLCSSWPSTVVFDSEGFVTLIDLGGKRLYMGWPCDFDIFSRFSRLSTLNLAGTDLPLPNVMKILETLSNQIETLFLGGNGFRQEGGQAIGIWLPSAKKLTKLDLRYNDIGGVGMEHLCDGLKDTNLRYLFVEGNQIGDQGAIAISNLLKNIDSKLEEVFLGANQVTAEGAISISSCLEDNKTVNKIYLEGNNIGIVGADAFSTALEELDGNTGLRNLFVDNNNIGKDGSKRLANALNSSTAIADSLLE